MRLLLGYESAAKQVSNSGRTFGDRPLQPPALRRQGGGNQHTIKLSSLSGHSAESIERSEFDSPRKADIWAIARDQDREVSTDVDVESTADDVYRHPFARTEFSVQYDPPKTPLPSTASRRTVSAEPQTPDIVVHPEVFINSGP